LFVWHLIYGLKEIKGSEMFIWYIFWLFMKSFKYVISMLFMYAFLNKILSFLARLGFVYRPISCMKICLYFLFLFSLFFFPLLIVSLPLSQLAYKLIFEEISRLCRPAQLVVWLLNRLLLAFNYSCQVYHLYYCWGVL